VCPPSWREVPVFVILHAALGLVLPFILMLTWNFYIISVARYIEVSRLKRRKNGR
jgi:hypothetical protein